MAKKRKGSRRFTVDGRRYEIKIGSNVVNIRDLETRKSVNAPLSEVTANVDYGMPIYPSSIADWIKEHSPIIR